jgi:hypothetical protein
VDTFGHRGYVIREENGRWCVNLGIEKGIQCFDSPDEAKAAVDARIREIEEQTKGKP